MEAHEVADDAEPEVDVAVPLGQARGGVDGALEVDVAVGGAGLAVGDHPHAHGRLLVEVGLAGRDGRLPDHRAAVVEDRVLRGEVDVDVAVAPVLTAGVVLRGGLDAGDVDGGGLPRLDVGRDLLRQGGAVDAPAVGARAVARVGAGHGDGDPVRARVGAVLADGVELVGELAARPLLDGGGIKGDREVVSDGDPAGDARGVDLGDRGAGERERDGRGHERIGRVDGSLDVGVGLGALVADLDLSLAGLDRGGHRVGHQVGVEAAGERLLVDDEGGALGAVGDAVTLDGRRRGELLDCGRDDVREPLAVKRDRRLGGEVAGARELDGPCPRVRLGEGAADVGVAVAGEAHLLGGDGEVEPLAGDVNLVVVERGALLLGDLGGGPQGDVLAVERGAGEEGGLEVEGAPHVGAGEKDDEAQGDGPEQDLLRAPRARGARLGLDVLYVHARRFVRADLGLRLGLRGGGCLLHVACHALPLWFWCL